MPTRLFTPSQHHVASHRRVDTPADIRDVIALVTVHGDHDTKELVIGIDLGRVIRVVATRDLPPRARAQLAYHERARRQPLSIHADELYVMDVQSIERAPDAPGADDPLYLHGVLRGPYPGSLARGVYGIEGHLATRRGPLLDGLAFGIARAFRYASGQSGTRCVHAALPIDTEPTRSVVLAFPLVPMGDDGSNELVAGHLIHEVLGAMRTDLGDDLAKDPVPVPDRAHYERTLAAAGWVIDRKANRATRRRAKGRFVSLFIPARRQRLPKQIALADYLPLIEQQLNRLPRWSQSARAALRVELGLTPGTRPPKPKARGSFPVRRGSRKPRRAATPVPALPPLRVEPPPKQPPIPPKQMRRTRPMNPGASRPRRRK